MKPFRPARPLHSSEYSRRRHELLDSIAGSGMDGAVVADQVSLSYLIGQPSMEGTLLLDSRRGAMFCTDFRYIVAAERALPDVKCHMTSRETDVVADLAAKWKSCGYEGRMSVSSFARLKTRLGNVKRWKKIDDVISKMRSVKSPTEIKALEAAIKANDKLFQWTVEGVAPGMTEWDVRTLIRNGTDIFGQGESFPTIACVGANATECHHVPGMAKIRNGIALLIDFGLVVDGYHADLTRNIRFGRQSALYEKVYAIVLEANRRVVDQVRPGMTGAEVDAIARDFIRDNGYGENFGHSLGHSIGLEIHEGPNFSPTCDEIIKPGMVITVEPGIYLPGKLGIRIEDDILITDKGCRCLSHSPR